MNRRQFHFALAGLVAVPAAEASWSALEARCKGRLGVAVLRPDGTLSGHRLDERFPMCSTFKWVLAAQVLQRVDRGDERLERRVRFGRDALVSYSPVTETRLDGGMTVGELCEAAVTLSDNGAANLLLAASGGPAALTAFARAAGDPVTRLDRMEPELNEGRPGDPRDTTSPAAMARLMKAALTAEVLSPAGRQQLARWLEASQTNTRRLRAGVPAGWRMGSKTGTGARGSTNDVGFFVPPGAAAPTFVSVYITDSDAPMAEREAVIAAVARALTRA